MIKLYNTSAKAIVPFKSIHPKRVSLYSCGPTVYDRQHIGNLRKSLFDDLLKRTLMIHGYTVYSVTNITDVGHLISDEDIGEDKLEKGAKRENLTAIEVADKYTKMWREDLDKLNIIPSDHYPKATNYIKEQINLIKRLERKGYTYTIADGIYFDTTKFPEYADFARLNLEAQEAGARVDIGDKKSPSDFALWKFSPKDGQRQMEWDSPWGIGFPGWHSECVVMADSLLHAPFDIHTGGKDHIPIHHTNEIAQFTADTGKSMAHYWLHSYFLTVDKTKMSKSAGTFITLDDIIDKGYSPLDLRLLVLMAHYRSDIDFSWDSLQQAKQSRNRILTFIHRVQALPHHKRNLKLQKLIRDTYTSFRRALFNDLDSPQAIAQIFEFIRSINSAIDDGEPIPRRHIIKAFQRLERILALDILEKKTEQDIPTDILELFNQRNKARADKNFTKADELRDELYQRGYTIKDTSDNSTISPNSD
jgi:cysteinyl-tRNA synthetase